MKLPLYSRSQLSAAFRVGVLVLDFTSKKAHDSITLQEIKAKADQIKEGDMVLIRTDLDQKWRTGDWEPFPYFECDALEWLLENKNPKAVGSDATSIKNPHVEGHPKCTPKGGSVSQARLFR